MNPELQQTIERIYAECVSTQPRIAPTSQEGLLHLLGDRETDFALFQTEQLLRPGDNLLGYDTAGEFFVGFRYMPAAEDTTTRVFATFDHTDTVSRRLYDCDYGAGTRRNLVLVGGMQHGSGPVGLAHRNERAIK